MLATSVSQLIPVLQVAIGPVILISGAGLILLAMTNRFGRIIDRSRSVGRQLDEAGGAGHELLRAQLTILWRRARIVRMAIALDALSVLLAAILIIVIFLTALFSLEDAWLIVLLFSGCMLSLIGAMVAFLRDVNVSLRALRLELGENRLPPQ